MAPKKKLGFPRLHGSNKIFIWKRMNFETDLPKSDPQATYIVASSNKGSQKNSVISKSQMDYAYFEDQINSNYRMHIVWLYNSAWKNELKNETEFPEKKKYWVVVQLLKVKGKRKGSKSDTDSVKPSQEVKPEDNKTRRGGKKDKFKLENMASTDKRKLDAKLLAKGKEKVENKLRGRGVDMEDSRQVLEALRKEEEMSKPYPFSEQQPYPDSAQGAKIRRENQHAQFNRGRRPIEENNIRNGGGNQQSDHRSRENDPSDHSGATCSAELDQFQDSNSQSQKTTEELVHQQNGASAVHHWHNFR